MKYNKKNIFFLSIFLLFAIIIGLKGNLLNLKGIALILVFIVLDLTYSIIIKNRKYKNLHKISEANRRKYNMAIDALNGAVWEWNSKSQKLSISPKIKDILMVETEISTFPQLFSFIINEERESIKLFINEIIEKKMVDKFILENTIINSIGQKVIVEIQGKSKIENEILYISGFITDITERKRIGSINNVIENKNRLAVEGSKDIVFWWNVNQNIISLDKSIQNYLDVELESDLIIPYTEWKNYILDEDLLNYEKQISKVIACAEDEFYSIEYRIEDKRKNIIWFQVKAKKTSEKAVDTFIYGSISDITQRKEKEIENNYLSYNDEITSIPNRRYFIKEVTEYINANPIEKMAVIFIDLDNFKYINDTYGHDVGDKLLIEFTKLINEMNIENSFFARYGGDEFVIVKYNLKGKTQIKVILDEIIKKLSKPIIVEDKEVFCTLSIGVSIYPLDGKNIGILVKRADMAMYLAKVNGKNRYEFFDIAMLESLDREFKIEKGLRIAIDNNEIKMVYQPKINTSNEKVMGFEALVRWNSKELGIVSPNEFIPIAESSGIIISLGKYIIDESFKRCKELTMLTDKDFKMAINLSDVQIRDLEIVEYIKNSLKRYDLNARYIEFEITESIIMKVPEKNVKTLAELKKLGVTLALDDFGTGYSSLSYLRTLPIDVLKIDKSFIDGILIEKKSEYIINSVVELSHFLDLVVVAEGVETFEQLKYLKDINCDIIQGYYYSKPIEFTKASNMIIAE
ncbi:EAL domain-containing protein [Clostridium sp.]|uniref:sensor domain-containing protein n=1 Tax=Clostridium sp. TaxID=1506 RepID=UPI00262C8005|nr:EAL domain-containing protein [Clostridium sp.]